MTEIVNVMLLITEITEKKMLHTSKLNARHPV